MQIDMHLRTDCAVRELCCSLLVGGDASLGDS